MEIPERDEEDMKMKYISSQHYINDEIVEAKIEELAAQNVEEVIISCSYVGFIDGVEYAMQNDKHHTLAAARALGIRYTFEVREDAEGLTGEALLDARWNDDDYYDVEDSDPQMGIFNTIW